MRPDPLTPIQIAAPSGSHAMPCSSSLCVMGIHKWEESERVPEDPQAGLWKMNFTRTCVRCGKVRNLYQSCGAIYEH